MGIRNSYQSFVEAATDNTKLLAILIDPDKFDLTQTEAFLARIPSQTTHLFVGGSTVASGATEKLVKALKLVTFKPVIIFPGDYTQITDAADGLLFLSLLSGRNPEYLIGQQLKAVAHLRSINLEVIATSYLLIDGGNESAVARVTGTFSMPQQQVQKIVDTAKAGELMGAKLVYLEAGSGAKVPVNQEIISRVKKELNIPVIVGGGIRTDKQREAAYNAGADMVVIGTAYEQ